MEHMQKTILGPPGCGKTQTNIRMVQGFIASGIPPEKIACVSFTRKAAEEAKSRICEEMAWSAISFPFSRRYTPWHSGQECTKAMR